MNPKNTGLGSSYAPIKTAPFLDQKERGGALSGYLADPPADSTTASKGVWVDPRDEATVERVSLIMAEHHRLDPMTSKDRCTCGYKTQLGRLYTAHIARAILAALEKP
jgi:hypothetical protein